MTERPSIPKSTQPAASTTSTSLDPCTVAKLEQLPNTGAIAFPGYFATTTKDASGIYQLHVTKPDGSPGPCLTCSASPGAPAVGLNKMLPYVEPTQKWVVFGVEWPHHSPYVGQEWQKYLEMANGWYMDLWAVSIDGQKWIQLTNYAETEKFAGVVSARVSRDGSKMIWSKLVARPDKTHAWGFFQMYEADFLSGSGDAPKLSNTKNITNPKGTWYEPEDFSPDSSKFVFVSNIASPDVAGDIWEMDVATGSLKNLTASPTKWDEHARFSPSGKKIAWMSSYPYVIDPLTAQTTKTELMVMNADGSGVRQITHFNTPGFPEYDQEKNAAGTPQWNADGSQVIINDLFLGRRYPERRWFKITFAGKCGG